MISVVFVFERFTPFEKFFLAINHCTLGDAGCATTGSTCSYTGPGTFTCSCNTGYSGNGQTCAGSFFFPFFFLLYTLIYFPWQQSITARLEPTIALPMARVLQLAQEPFPAPATLVSLEMGPPALVSSDLCGNGVLKVIHQPSI